MGLTRADLIGEMTDEERASRQQWIDRTMANDQWAKKIFHKVGVLLTSHQANRPYLHAGVESHAKLGFWITLAYDNYVDPTQPDVDHNKFMPGKDTLDLVNLFLTPTYQTWGGPLFPYFWLLKWGTLAMSQFEYIYCANGDMVLEKPEGFPALFSLLGDADIMTTGPDNSDPTKDSLRANTAGFIAKTSALLKIVQHLQDHLVPWDAYEKHTQFIGNMEGRLGHAIHDLGLKQVTAPTIKPPLEDMLREPGHGTWAELLGFRHIHSEMNHSYRRRGVPPPSKYLDPRFTSEHDLRHIKLYEETGDLTVLEPWWAKED